MPPALAPRCARQTPAPRIAGRSRCAPASAFSLAWKPGRVALAGRRPASPAPRNRLRASPSARAPTSSPVAPFAGSGRNARRLRAARCQQALPLSRPSAARRSGPALGAAALLPGRPGRGAPAPALRRLNTEGRLVPPALAPVARDKHPLRHPTLALASAPLETTAARLARLAVGSGSDVFASCSLRRLRSQQARRLRCASRRRRLALASHRTSRRPPANRRCRSRGLRPLAGPALRSAPCRPAPPAAPSLAFAGALLPGRPGRGAPAPALRRLNTEGRLVPPALAPRCARQTPAPRVAGRARCARHRPSASPGNHRCAPAPRSLDALALASPGNHRCAARWTPRACGAAAGFAGASKQAPRLAVGSGSDVFASCSLRRLRSQQARRLRCASRRRRLALAPRNRLRLAFARSWPARVPLACAPYPACRFPRTTAACARSR